LLHELEVVCAVAGSKINKKKLTARNLNTFACVFCERRGPEAPLSMLSIFLEYVPGGSVRSLLDRFGAFEEAVVARYGRQILSGLDYLHAHGIAHRDIKAQTHAAPRAPLPRPLSPALTLSPIFYFGH
jgi:serine/threonine protein kinase